jgi:transposase InsO family protein
MAGQRTLYPLAVMCRVLDVTRGGYYAWERRREQPPGERERRRAELAREIRAVHHDSRRTYGSPRVCHQLKARGVDVCENTVAKVMRQEGIRSVVRRRFKARTTDSCHRHPVAPNVLGRDFAAQAPDRKWAADITYVPTAEGWLYLAVVLDLCSRRVVGWAMADHLRAELCLDALDMALKRRRPGAGLVHHSDRGVQYACGDYRDLLRSQGIECSMSRRGDCYDNAAAESFFKTLKVELVYQQRYATREQARRSIFEYIEVFYNRQRLHSSLGYESPERFEAAMN